MKFLQILFLFLCLVSLLACNAKLNSPDVLSRTYNLYLHGNAIGFTPVQVNGLGVGEMTGISGGRTHCFQLRNSAGTQVSFSCSNLGNEGFFSNNNFCVRFSHASSAGSKSFSCSSQGDSFSLKFTYTASSYDLLNEGSINVHANFINGFSMSKNNKFMVYDTQSTFHNLTFSGSQVVLVNLETNEIKLVSTADGTTAGNSDSYSPVVTEDGRYVFFASYATNLAGTISFQQIFKKDMQTQAVSLVSSTNAGVQGDNNSFTPQVSQDGRYVVFSSYAANLVPGTSNSQVFKKDLQTQAVTLVSSNHLSVVGDGNAVNPQISSDGRYVIFESDSTNLTGDTGNHVYRKDTQTGTIVLVSASAGGVAGDSQHNYSSMTPDGRYVAFRSSSTNLLPVVNPVQAYRKDVQTGAIQLISSNGSGTESDGGGIFWPILSPDGAYAIFSTNATNFGVPGGMTFQVYRKNLQSGALDLVSVNAQGVATTDINPQLHHFGTQTDQVFFANVTTALVPGTMGQRYYQKNVSTGTIQTLPQFASGTVFDTSMLNYSFSADDTYMVFNSNALNISASNAYDHIYVKNLSTGEIQLASSTSGGVLADRASYAHSISGDGRYVGFNSEATNLIPGVTSNRNCYRKDTQTGQIDLVSANVGGVVANDNSYNIRLDASGRYAVFDSAATNLMVGVSGYQVFYKDMQTGVVSVVSATSGGLPGDNNSDNAFISSNGRYVAFVSSATILDGGPGTHSLVHLKDMQTGAVQIMSKTLGGVVADAYAIEPKISSNGRYVAFISSATNLGVASGVDQIYVKDAVSGTLYIASTTSGGVPSDANCDSPTISADGTYVAFQTAATTLGNPTAGGQVYVKNIQTGALQILSTDSNCSTSGPVFSPGSKLSFYGGNCFIGGMTNGFFLKSFP